MISISSLFRNTMDSIEVINKIKSTVLSNAVVNEEGGLIEQNIIDSSEDKIISGFIFGSSKLADGEFVQIKKRLELTSTNFDYLSLEPLKVQNIW